MKKNEKTLKIKSIISKGKHDVLNVVTGVLETKEDVIITVEDDTLPYIKGGSFEKAERDYCTLSANYVLDTLKRVNADIACVPDFNVIKANHILKDGGTITFEIKEWEPGDVDGKITYKHTCYRYGIVGATISDTMSTKIKEYTEVHKDDLMKGILGF